MNTDILLIDIDNTIFSNYQRNHLVPDDVTRCENWTEWAEACDTDKPISKWIALIETLTATRMYTPVFLTSRPDSCHNKTVNMISQYLPVTYSQLKQENMIMRRDSDHEKPADFKLLRINDIGTENIALAIDDDQSVCSMMISMGIPVLNVNPKKRKPELKTIQASSAQKIRRALGKDIMNHIDVEYSETLVDEYDADYPYVSMIVSMKSKPESDMFVGLDCYLQIDFHYDNDESVYEMIFGEDIEANINKSNVFEYLFYYAFNIEKI